MAKKRKTLKDYTNLEHLTTQLLTNLPYVMFLGFLALVYIANVHFAQGNVRKIQKLKREIKELRWQSMSLQSENMVRHQRSEIEKSVKDLGLRPLNENPKILVIKE